MVFRENVSLNQALRTLQATGIQLEGLKTTCLLPSGSIWCSLMVTLTINPWAIEKH